MLAPSGVTMAGVALVLRDLVQRRLGVAAASLAIFSEPRSALLAPPALVLASASAFLLSEFADLAVYPAGPARAGHGGGGVRGGRADRGSIVFLWLAFGSLDF